MARTLHQHRRQPVVPCSGNAARQHGHRDISTRTAPTAIVTAARRLNRAAGTIATSVLIDSAMEHYRGNFHNKAMWTPIVTSSLSIAVSMHGLSDKRMALIPCVIRLCSRRVRRERSAQDSTSTMSPRRSAASTGRISSIRRRSARRRPCRCRG